MKIEHVAINVSDPASLAQWYVEHLGFDIKRRSEAPLFVHFLADGSGTVMIEVYHNSAAPIPEYSEQHPLVLHLALSSDDVKADRQRLIAAGATSVGDLEYTDAGDVLAMVRDPWGLAIQLVKRSHPMI